MSGKRGGSFFTNVLASDEASQSGEPAQSPRKSFLGAELHKHRGGLEAELEAMKSRYEGSFPVKKISASLVHRGPWANRLEMAFDESLDEAFRVLKSQIKAHGGNAAPIFVRTIVGKDTYELVYGERRWRACSQLGLDVQAVIGTISDEEAILLQHHENQGRADISVIESAYQICSWDEGLKYGQSSILSDRMGITSSYLSNLRLIGKQIPPFATQAHPNIRSLNFRQARSLAVLFRDSPDLAQQRVEALKAHSPIPGASEATNYLLTGKWAITQGAKPSASKTVRASYTEGGLELPTEHLAAADKDRFLKALAALGRKFGITLPKKEAQK